MNEIANIPRHIGYIMDGNRRWARAHGIPSYEGHLAGYNTFKDILRATIKKGVEYISFYAFSSENWKRSDDEVNKLMKLGLRLFKTDLQELIDDNIRLQVIGREEGLSSEVIKAARLAEQKTAHCSGATLVLCINYGGQLEIVDAARKLIDKGVASSDINEATMSENMYAPHVPPVDMIVRLGGEKRLSNFMLWRSSYSELLFLDKLWPDMTSRDVTNIINEYAKRQRRFGN